MRKWLVCLISATVAVAACSDDSADAPVGREDTGAPLVAALEQSAAAEEQTITLTIESTPQSLAAAVEARGIPREAAETILDSSLTISRAPGKGAAGRNGRIALEVPGTEGGEVVFAAGDLFLRADVRGLADALGQDMTMIDLFLESAAADEVPFLETVLDGGFIRIEGTQELPGNAGATDQLAQQQEQLLRELADAIRTDARVTVQGKDDVGEHFVVSIPFAHVYRRLVDLSARLGGHLTTPSPGVEVPEGDLEVDAWVSDGRLARIEVDLARLDEQTKGDLPDEVEELALRMDFSDRAEAISAPRKAVTVPGEQLMALIFGGGLPGDVPTDAPDDPGGGGDAFDCSPYEGLPPETFEGLPQDVLDQLEQTCPEVVPN